MAKATATKKHVSRIHAGGIMVDVIESKPSKASKGKQPLKGKIVAQNAAGSEVKPTLDNCYREGSNYAHSLNALRKMGIGKMHGFKEAIKAVQKEMGPNGWIEFSARKPRNKKTGKNAIERLTQNLSVIARKKDYGKSIVEAGHEVRFDGRKKEVGLFKVGK